MYVMSTWKDVQVAEKLYVTPAGLASPDVVGHTRKRQGHHDAQDAHENDHAQTRQLARGSRFEVSVDGAL